MAKMISYQRPDGQHVNGYLAEPPGATPAPGIVVIQEWWGLNDQIKGVADTLASQGYRALVPDLYRGKVALAAKEAEHLMNELNFGDAAGQDVRGAVAHLKGSGSAKVGVTGFCMGGALTLLSAVFVPELDAGVAWYGYPPLEYIDASKIKIPLMGHWATGDVPFPIAKVADLEQKRIVEAIGAVVLRRDGHLHLDRDLFSRPRHEGLPHRLPVVVALVEQGDTVGPNRDQGATRDREVTVQLRAVGIQLAAALTFTPRLLASLGVEELRIGGAGL